MSRGEQIARQWQVLRVLENHRYGICLDDLAARLECSRRTLERDLRAMLDMGFPIQSETGNFGKKQWKLAKDFTDNLILTPTETISLYLANQLINPLAGSYLDDGWKQFMDKIQSILPPTVFNYFSELDETVYVKPPQSSKPVPSEYLETIRKAMHQTLAVQLGYKRDKPSYTITFHPYGLIVYENSFYAIGYSEKHEEVRTLKLQRIVQLEMTKKKFQRPDDFSLEKCFKGTFGIIEDMEKGPATVRCEMTGWAARVVREQKWHRTQVIEQDKGDKVIVSFYLDSTVEFKRWVLGFGPMVRVLEPEITKNEIIEMLQKALENYKHKDD